MKVRLNNSDEKSLISEGMNGGVEVKKSQEINENCEHGSISVQLWITYFNPHFCYFEATTISCARLNFSKV